MHMHGRPQSGSVVLSSCRNTSHLWRMPSPKKAPSLVHSVDGSTSDYKIEFALRNACVTFYDEKASSYRSQFVARAPATVNALYIGTPERVSVLSPLLLGS